MIGRTSKIIAAVSGIIIAVGCIFYLVNGFKGIADLSSYSGDYIDSVRMLSIFEIVCAFIAMFLGMLTMVMGLLPDKPKKRVLDLLIAAFVVILVEKLVTIIWGYAIVSKYNPGASLDTVSIFIILFTVFSLIFFIITDILVLTNKEKPVTVFGSISLGFFFILLIIILANSGNSNGFGIAYSIFLLFAVITTSVCLGFYGVREMPAISSIPNPFAPKKDASDELLKLKSLLDAGAITQEEYDEKRQKYVDKL